MFKGLHVRNIFIEFEVEETFYDEAKSSPIAWQVDIRAETTS